MLVWIQRLFPCWHQGFLPEYAVIAQWVRWKNHSGTDPQLAALISDSYAGSVRFTGDNLNFAASGCGYKIFGTASMITAFPMTQRALQVHLASQACQLMVLIMGMQLKASNVALAGRGQAGYDDDLDMVLNDNQEIFEVNIAETTFSNNGNEALLN